MPDNKLILAGEHESLDAAVAKIGVELALTPELVAEKKEPSLVEQMEALGFEYGPNKVLIERARPNSRVLYLVQGFKEGPGGRLKYVMLVKNPARSKMGKIRERIREYDKSVIERGFDLAE